MYKYNYFLFTALLSCTIGFSQEENTEPKNDSINTLNEVVLVSKIGVTQVEPQRIRYSAKDLPSQNGGTAGDLLKNMPSVSMGGSPNHNRDIRFRGLGNGYTTVLINGKQSGLTGNNRETVLDMIPATQIDYIEIISNPSADNTANGINGIVNIVLKKGTQNDAIGQLSFYADNQDGTNSSVMLQHSKDNFTISGSFEKLKRRANKFDDGLQTKFNNDGTLKETVGIHKDELKSFDNTTATARVGYNTKTNWKFVTEYIFGEQIEDKDKQETNLTYKADGSFKSGKNRLETEDKLSRFYNPSLSIEKNWKNSTLGFNVNTNFSREQKDKLLKDYGADENGTRIETALPTQQSEKEVINFKNFFPSIDFKSKINERAWFKTGYQGFITNRNSDRLTTKLDNTTNEWAIVPTNTNRFDLDENTHTAFITTNWTFDKVKIVAGYRHEYTEIKSTSTSETQEKNDSNYSLALPNLSLTYNLTEKSYLKSSVGKRVRRPAFADMNPFIEIKSATEIKVGNPDLQPETAWAYEVGYFNEIKIVNFGFNVFYRDIDNLIQKSIVTDQDGITTESFQNLNKATTSGAEILVGIQPLEWYNVNLNFSRFWSKIKDSENFDGDAIKDQTDWIFKVLQDFSLPQNIRLQLTSNFVGPKKTTQESEKTIWFTDLGIEKQLLKNGFLSIRVSDIFDSLKKQKTKNTIVQIEEMTENTPGRVLSAGIRWQF